MVFLVCTGEAVRPCARAKDAYFPTVDTRFVSGVRLTLIPFIYQKGPIDGTHGCAQKMVFLVSTGEAVRPCARAKDAYFPTVDTRFVPGVRLTLNPFIYQTERTPERCVLRGATQKSPEIFNNAGNHAGYHPGMACRGCHLGAFPHHIKR
eukprot:gene11064-biopygen9386